MLEDVLRFFYQGRFENESLRIQVGLLVSRGAMKVYVNSVIVGVTLTYIVNFSTSYKTTHSSLL